MNYNAPGVYIEDIVSGSQNISQVSSSVCALIGVTQNGVEGVAQKIGTWSEYVSKYAKGLDTPYTENSYLPYAVNGFFANGGKELYVCNVKKKNAEKAIKVSEVNKITATALSSGIWGNTISISIKKNVDFTEDYKSFDVHINVGVNDTVVIRDNTLSQFNEIILNDKNIGNYLSDFSISEDTTELSEETFVLEGGTDGDELSDTDYINALNMLDNLDDLTFVAIPGQTSQVVNDALISYCEEHGLFPFLNMPIGSSVEETKAYRKSISAFTGALVYPWGRMNDPLTNKLKTVPNVGHVMGVYARCISNRGVHKAPAGVDAVVRGFVAMEFNITPTQLSTLNPIGVICILPRPDCGIVIWGARSLNSTDTKMRYVTDGLLNLSIKKSLYRGTQFAVFEPNDSVLWSRISASCKDFLETLRVSGALKGTSKDAYYVIVDETNNTESTIEDGYLFIDVGYAPVKPAEFIVIRLAHSIVSE